VQVAICAPVWGRPDVTEIFWVGAKRLLDSWRPHTTQIYVAGDEPVHRDLAEKHGGRFLDLPNRPLGRKASTLVETAWKDGAEYVLSLGSDDVVHPSLGAQYLQAMTDDRAYVGLQGCYMVEPRTCRAMRLDGHANVALRWGETIGAGRLLSRRVLDKVHGRPWPDGVMKGMDWRMTIRLQYAGITTQKFGTDLTIPLTTDAYLVDIKGSGSMWGFDHVARHTHVTRSAAYGPIVDGLPEAGMIHALEPEKCHACGQPLA